MWRYVGTWVFPVVMYGCESWTVKKAECQRIDAFELWCCRLSRVPLDCKEIQPVHSKGDQPWDFFGRNDAKAETPILWPPHAKSWLIGKDSDAGRDWGQEEKGMTADEMAGWHHWLDGHEGLECCDSWGRKELDTTEWLLWTEFISFFIGVWLVYNVALVSALQCSESCKYTYIPSLLNHPPTSQTPSHPPPHPTPLGHHRALSWTPCAIQQLPTSYQISHSVVYICLSYSPNLSHPPLPCCAHIPILNVCASIPALQIGSSVPFS